MATPTNEFNIMNKSVAAVHQRRAEIQLGNAFRAIEADPQGITAAGVAAQKLRAEQAAVNTKNKFSFSAANFEKLKSNTATTKNAGVAAQKLRREQVAANVARGFTAANFESLKKAVAAGAGRRSRKNRRSNRRANRRSNRVTRSRK